MKLAFNELSYEVINTGLLKNLVADVKLAEINSATFVTLEPALYAEPLNGKFQFLAQKLLEGHSLLTPSVPNLSATGILAVSNYLAKIKLSYRTTPVQNTTEVAIMGGGSNDVDTLSVFTAKKKFLTHQPTTKVIDTKQKDVLYWLHEAANYATAISTVTLQYEVKFEDGTYQTFNGAVHSVGAATTVLAVPVSYLAIAAFETLNNNIVSFTVKLIDNNSLTISERRTYIIAPMQDLPTVIFYFRNSFNLFDCVRFDGSFSENYEVTSQNTENGSQELVEYGSEGFKKLKISTGRLQRSWLTYLKELLLSNEAYILLDGKLVRVVKVAKSLAGIDTGKRDDVGVIEYRLAKIESYS